MDIITFNEVVPAVNQIETHPFHQQIETQKFLRENGVQIESWGPFAEGRNNLFQNELLQSIASKYQRSVAQVVLRWLHRFRRVGWYQLQLGIGDEVLLRKAMLQRP